MPSHGYEICIGSGHPDNIDYDNPVATTADLIETDDLSVAGLGLVDDVDYYIDVIARSVAVEPSQTAGPVHVRISGGVLVSPSPNPIVSAHATAAVGGKVRIEVMYDASNELAVATKLAVARLVAGSIDWTSPVQEIAISGDTAIDEILSAVYDDGEFVHLAVRAETAAGVQGTPAIMAPVAADTTAPPAPGSLTAVQE